MEIFNSNPMRKKIAILGSTGSIGKTLINIIKQDKKNFEIVLLSAEGNYKELLKQAKFFNVKNLIITNKKSFEILKKKNNVKIKKFQYDTKIIKKIGLKSFVNIDIQIKKFFYR